MNKEIALRWAAALRSGLYQQTQCQLRQGQAFCCLGVLCDLHSQESGSVWTGESYLDRDSTVPKRVQQWAQLLNEHGGFALGWQPVGPATAPTLAAANDIGCSFSEIAQAIEQHWQQL